MEVHHHSHTSRKKWAHYFWEFFMLFLAVTLGFFVENQREHYVEHMREKQYMQSMIEDLKTDTAEVKNMLSNLDASIRGVDSMLSILTKNTSDEAIIKSYQFAFPALNNIPVTFTDRTITQLKNSGNMRLIRNQKVNDGLIHYWNHIEDIEQALNRQIAYRTKGRDMEARIFNIAEIFINNDGRIANPSGRVHLVMHDPVLIKEYANVIAQCGVMLLRLKVLIKEQDGLAIELIKIIRKEYHLG